MRIVVLLLSLVSVAEAQGTFLERLSSAILSRDASQSNSHRILRTKPDKEEDGRVFGNIWEAAVTTSSSTATNYQKCRLEDGTVTTIGGDYGKGKGKKSKGACGGKGKSKNGMKSAKGKGSTCTPTVIDVESGAPSVSASPSVSAGPSPGPTVSSAPSTSAPPSASVAPTGSLVPSSSPTGSEVPSESPTISEVPSFLPSAFPSGPTSLPSASPSDECTGKGKSKKCKSKKKKASDKRGPKDGKGKGSDDDIAKSGKGKGKYEDVDLPLCTDLDTPAASPVIVPTAAQDELERCAGIIDGTGTGTGDPAQTARLFFIVVWESSTTPTDLTTQLEEFARIILADATGCSVTFAITSRRQLADTPEFVELEGLALLNLGDDACTAVSFVGDDNDTCSVYDAEAKSYGGNFGSLAESCAEYADDFVAATSALGVEKLHCVVDQFPLDILQPTASPLAPSESGSGDADEENDVITGIIDDPTQNRSRESVSPGGFIGIAGAGLIVLLALLLFARRGRDRDKTETRVYEITDDEGEDEKSNFLDEKEVSSDGMPDAMPDTMARGMPDTMSGGEMSADGMSADMMSDGMSQSTAPLQPRLAHVVGEDDSQYTGTSWGNKSRIRVEPVMSTAEDAFSQDYEISPDGTAYEEDVGRHGAGQTCSSPSCQICESRRQQGAKTKFVRNQKYDPKPASPSSQDRNYMSSDTVDL